MAHVHAEVQDDRIIIEIFADDDPARMVPLSWHEPRFRAFCQAICGGMTLETGAQRARMSLDTRRITAHYADHATAQAAEGRVRALFRRLGGPARM